MTTTILILAAFGILALLAEMVLPGAVLGIAGGLCLLAASVLCFVEYGPVAGTIATLSLVAFSALLFWAWMKFFHLLPGTRELVLNEKIAAGDGRSDRESESLKGQIGEAITEIAPSGRALVAGNRIDVISESGAVPKGKSVEMIRRSGASWVVREVSDSE